MFEEGHLLLFRPFIFKNWATPKDKFFLVLKKHEGNLLLACLPTSKDHVPSDLILKHGCLDFLERIVNVFVFMAGEPVAIMDDGRSFSFKKHTFIYGANLDTYPEETFRSQERTAQTRIESIGVLDKALFTELLTCLSESKMVKNKFRRMLQP